MKKILYALFIFSGFTLSGQTTIGPEVIVNIGEESPTLFLDFNSQNWDSQSTGPNQNWDYSALIGGQLCNYEALDPSDSVYRDSFPESDIYFICTFTDTDGNESEEHTFYNIEGDILQLAGNVSMSISNPSYDSIFIVYSDPLNWGTFPYIYQGNSDDTFKARVTSYIGGQVIRATQEGTSTHEVESYGRLMTPAGTFEKTLRIKRTELAENSVVGFPISTPQESYRYTWYAENEKNTILNLDSIVIKDISGNILNTNYSGSYRQQGPTTSAINQFIPNDITIYPIPIKDRFYVEYTGNDELEMMLTDLNGKLLSCSTDLIRNGKNEVYLLETSVSTGTYLLNVINQLDRTHKIHKVTIINK